jgi:hypothetical protein
MKMCASSRSRFRSAVEPMKHYYSQVGPRHFIRHSVIGSLILVSGFVILV